MPRAARRKSENALYHVMCRSISERDLFPCDEDKEYYLSLLKKYCEKFHCKVYAYCLMDNHVHIYIDPCGFDISTYMRHLNTAYVSYFNRRYKRHGHLFRLIKFFLTKDYRESSRNRIKNILKQVKKMLFKKNCPEVRSALSHV